MTVQSPSNAVGTTHAITGGITVLPSGKVDPAQSRITVDLSTLVTDKENRDRWIKSHTLRTDSFPKAVIVVRDLPGLPATLPMSGTLSLRLVGDLTIHGVTRPSTWDVTMTANGNEYTGTASTHIKFEEFGMEQPRLMIVVSVVDDVQLQYNFHFVRSATP
jgi:polyisoprenoid-binding protein YceI